MVKLITFGKEKDQVKVKDINGDARAVAEFEARRTAKELKLKSLGFQFDPETKSGRGKIAAIRRKVEKEQAVKTKAAKKKAFRRRTAKSIREAARGTKGVLKKGFKVGKKATRRGARTTGGLIGFGARSVREARPPKKTFLSAQTAFKNQKNSSGNWADFFASGK